MSVHEIAQNRNSCVTTSMPQLESMLPRVTWQRSLHETLAATADAMRVGAVSMGIPTKRLNDKAVILPRRTGKATSAQPAPAIIPALIASEDVIDDDTMRRGMLTSREVGVGLMTAELKFLEASPSLCAMLLGIDTENDGKALCGMSLATIINPADVEPMLRGLDYVTKATFGKHSLLTSAVYVCACVCVCVCVCVCFFV